MKRLISILVLSLLAGVLGAPTTASADDFGISEFDVRFTDADGEVQRQAGAHPFKMTTSFLINHSEVSPGVFFPDGGDIKDLVVEQVEGFVGSATAVPVCSALDFAAKSCSDASAVGATAALLKDPFNAVPAAVYNLRPPPGVPARLGFITANVPLVIDVRVKHSPDYNLVASVTNIPQPLTVFGSVLELWGVPADPRHDFSRGADCLDSAVPLNANEVILDGELNLIHEAGDPTCPANTEAKALLTLPRACAGALATRYELDAWDNPGAWVGNSVLTHDGAMPAGFSGCGKLTFSPGISSQMTADSAETGTGMDFSISFDDDGLISPKEEATAQSDIQQAVVTLPEGVTANPSIAEGLGVCTLGDLGQETVSSAPGQGCPNASKIGEVRVQSPLLNQAIEGSVFIAQPDDSATAAAENPFNSLIAFYIVLKSPELGVLVKVPARVEPDPRTGRLVTTVDDIPQLPFSRFDFHFREGQRAPLITPALCGIYATEARLTPRANPAQTLFKSAEFQISRGPGGGPCPPGVSPFDPGFQAGSLNNNAGSFSPFLMRLTRDDGEQNMTKFSATLPPGVLGSLVGVRRCPETRIALAASKSGRAEHASPSCPLASRIGSTLAGAGVGGALTYVPGHLYLAGPYKGSPLSVVAVTPALAGPFDAGTVVVRVALTLNPRTAEIEVDGSRSDPIPHILKGIPLKLRDLRVNADRSGFTLNPTSCDPSSTRMTLFGSYLDLLSPADDVPVALRARYQAANCTRLGYKPRLALRLKGGTKRGGHPSLRAVLRPRSGDANTEGIVARLPRSAFLDQGHIRTICTRVQFAADACPAGAIYGRVSVFTPLLEEPLRGPVYLRSSNNKLPDLVFDLHGLVDIEASARIDSIRGGIRATFTAIPDAPISKAVVHMQGGKKGLIVNSRNLCTAKARANVRLDAHNGTRRTVRPLLRAKCKKR